MESRLLLILLAPVFVACVMPWLGARLRSRVGWVALLAPLLSCAGVISLLGVPAAERSAVSWDWVPSLGVALTFNPDGLALFYGLVVAGVGVLVVFYAACYLDDHHYRDHGKFYCYLLLFMAAMLGTVFSSNLLVLFISWELTGLTSFLLIGFLHEKGESQRGARMALLTTATTGLALLVGVVLVRLVYGTFELSEILAAGVVPAGKEGLLTAAFLFCFVGIAGKSAQFPFHYWLPNAMAAPTPVSAYLHSATMVKLGVFLTARLLPVFNGLESWTPVLTTIGFGTLVLGAVFALLSQDLKGVLAYTTVAQLGLLVGHYGLYAQGVLVRWDYLHIFNHVFYKAALFMIVGIIDHSTGTRDLRQLGGLARKMPLVAIAAAITLAALAGLPPTTGFLSKEMLLKTLTTFWKETDGGAVAWWAMGCVLIASVLKVAIALGVWRRAFAGKPSEALEAHYHAPSFGLQLPSLLLAGAALAGGFFAPQFGALADRFAVAGVHAADVKELHLWHGFTKELGLSALVVALGACLYFVVGRVRWAEVRIPDSLRLDRGFEQAVEAVPYWGKALNRVLGFETPYAYLYIIVGALVLAAGAFVVPHLTQIAELAAGWAPWPLGGEGWTRWALVGLMSIAAVLAVRWQQPLKQVLALSVIGLGVTFYYVTYKAPDLALTQMLVETATLLLVLFLVLRIKRDGADRVGLARQTFISQGMRIGLAATAGLIMGAGVLLFQQPDPGERAGGWYLQHSLALSKGANAVNTVVIDFRGWDTLFEINVLVIAALGVLGLLNRARRTPDRAAIAAANTDFFAVPKDLILRYVAIAAFIPLNLFAVYLFLRGHNAPGGGFVAGLVSALSFLILVFVLGVHGVRRLLRVNPLSVAVAGVTLAVGVTLLPVAFGDPVLNHYHGYLFGFYLGTPFWLDLGVYLTVVGSVLKILLPLMKSVHGLPAFVSEEEGRFAERLSEPIDLAACALGETGDAERDAASKGGRS
jgi:multicomponent K+:H+ antiporter subunit A/multicomponent Na+:H+ antiporter subunit A